MPLVSADICNVLPRPEDSNGLSVVKLKRNLKYKGYVYFELVCPFTMYQTLDYLTSYNKFYEDNSISTGLSSKEMLRFSEMKPVLEENLETVPEKLLEMNHRSIKLRPLSICTELLRRKQL